MRFEAQHRKEKFDSLKKVAYNLKFDSLAVQLDGPNFLDDGEIKQR